MQPLSLEELTAGRAHRGDWYQTESSRGRDLAATAVTLLRFQVRFSQLSEPDYLPKSQTGVRWNRLVVAGLPDVHGARTAVIKVTEAYQSLGPTKRALLVEDEILIRLELAETFREAG